MVNDESEKESRTSSTDSEQTGWEETRTLLDQRIEQDPKDAASWANRGVLRLHHHDYEGADRDFDEAIRLAPADVYTLFWRGDLYSKMGRYSEAMDAYNEAIRLDPTNPSGFGHRGRCYAEQGRYAEAIADFTVEARLDPGSASAYFNRAMARSDEEVRDYDGALSDFDAFFRLEHDCTELITGAHGLRAFVYIALGLYREAIADLDEKINLTPWDADAYLVRSWLHKKTGDGVRAAEDRRKALELDPRVLDPEKD